MAEHPTTVTRAVRTGSLLRVELADLAAPVDDAMAVAVVRLVAPEAELLGVDVEPSNTDAGVDGPVSRVLAACADHLRAQGVARVAASVAIGHPERIQPLLDWGFRPVGRDARQIHLVLDL